MTLTFAPARPVTLAIARRSPVFTRLPKAANDNSYGQSRDNTDLIHAALKHFARHGVSAARQAADNARNAAKSGDAAGARHWLDICHALDRRLAAATNLHLRG